MCPMKMHFKEQASTASNDPLKLIDIAIIFKDTPLENF